MANGTNPTDELAGLQVAITAAVSGAITRSVTVLNRDYDNFYTGTYPLILLRLADFTLGRIAGGQTGLKGQQGREQNQYSIEIRDVVDPRGTSTTRVADSQSDLYALISAICDYFDHLPNQGMPISGTPTCYKAGEYIRFRVLRPFASEDGGQVNVVLAGTLSVIGNPRAGQAT